MFTTVLLELKVLFLLLFLQPLTLNSLSITNATTNEYNEYNFLCIILTLLPYLSGKKEKKFIL